MNLHTLQDVEEHFHAHQLPHLAIQDHHGDPYLISESGQIDEQGRLFWVGIPEGDEDGNRSTDGTGWLHDGPHDDGPSWPFTTLLPANALPDSEHTWGWVTEMPPSTPPALAADANKIADLVSTLIGGPAAWVPWSIRYGIAFAVLGAGYRVEPQGEPSDARVHAAAVAIDPAAWEPGIFYAQAAGARENSLDLARAALSAAVDVGVR